MKEVGGNECSGLGSILFKHSVLTSFSQKVSFIICVITSSDLKQIASYTYNDKIRGKEISGC